MNNFNKEKFAELILLAIGKSRSLNQYALSCDVSSAHISRLSRGLLDTPPHPEVLLKMAKASQGRVSYSELMSSAGYIEDIEIASNTRLLPVLGTVKAGYNYLAEQNIIDYINPYMEISDPENFFCLLVKGDSMSPQFTDGDYVVVHKTDNCFESGAICVVLINGDEATIKKVVKTEDGIELYAFNPYYPVKKYTFEEIKSLEIKIIGIVENQIRNWK